LFQIRTGFSILRDHEKDGFNRNVRIQIITGRIEQKNQSLTVNECQRGLRDGSLPQSRIGIGMQKKRVLGQIFSGTGVLQYTFAQVFSDQMLKKGGAPQTFPVIGVP
jgi:hypothetical protein